MNIAVANMTKGNKPCARDGGCYRALDLFEKGWDGRDGNADVVLDRAAFTALSLR